MIDSFPVFKIKSLSKKKDAYNSKQSGFIGLGPASADEGKNAPYNFLKKLRQAAQINQDIVSYNIKWNNNIDSYIQIGAVSKYITDRTRYISAESFEHFGLTITAPGLWFSPTNNEEQIPFPLEPKATLAIFDPQVDYMYVNGLDFKNWISPALHIYLQNEIECD